MSIKIEKYFKWVDPEIFISDKNFEINIVDDEVEITCYWDDYGWMGGGTVRIRIPLKTLKDIITEYCDELTRRKGIS